MAIARDLVAQIARLVRPLQVRIANSIARAVVQLVDDSTKLQLLQIGVLAGEDVDDAERFQEYGLSSVPLAGAEAVVLFPNGDRAHPLVIAVDDRRHRPTGGQPGEVTIYNSAGAGVRLKMDGTVESGTLGGSFTALAKADHTHSVTGLAAPSGGGTVTGTLGASNSNTTKLKAN